MLPTVNIGGKMKKYKTKIASHPRPMTVKYNSVSTFYPHLPDPHAVHITQPS
jgi:hypothetical protein